ncbi:ABC transporter ATP-binding protein [Conexibacter arvalis]|uniref:Oligopeptide/dipeptide ABC transporter ATP-binding protein n=1 Tax=Conexibacter arvalis TaxID=912552 RepID=A0A840IBD0_9ACTN|nr:ABC transporter ATP-binding protein [Conexibacter arvalis]MBB4661378.1 oligopeptide/dipeptide ABC transporter ATP-binding protein [Conexibacter arvalis]
MSALLEIEGLSVTIRRGRHESTPVRSVDLRVDAGEVAGVVGETGCGKTLTGLATLGLLPPGSVARGSVRVAGREVTTMDERTLRELRGREVAMVFQNAATAFDPVTTIGRQLTRVIGMRDRSRGGAATAAAVERLRSVGLPEPDRVMGSYPHQLSGGMLQRAMIALALSARPRLIVADEPTTALDVTVARRVRRLLLTLQQEHGFGVVFITHDLAEARDLCTSVNVLYAGTVVESGPVEQVLDGPAHPYTRALLAALPRLDAPARRLASLAGTVPRSDAAVAGCLFANRCAEAFERCRHERPRSRAVDDDRTAACHLWEEAR